MKKIHMTQSEERLIREVYGYNYNKIGRVLTIGEIIKRFRTEGRCVKFSPKTITHMASVLGFTKKRVGGKIGYDKSLITAITQRFDEAMEYESALKVKRPQRALKHPKTEPNYFMMNGEKDNRDYEWESIISRVIVEAIDELDLYHGTPHEFDEFDLAYLSTGFGQQSHGYGVYLTTSVVTAKAYSQGKNIYTVEVPDGKYLNYDKIGRTEAMQIARKFFKYYTTEHEYGKEAYHGHENEFWEYECKYLVECTDGGSIYGTIASLLGDDKDTSEFLYSIGYKGMYLKCSNTETKEKFKNYIIFNPKEIKILKKEKV